MPPRPKGGLPMWAQRRGRALSYGGEGAFLLPVDHKPFLRSPEGFSCAACRHLKPGDGDPRCGHPDYAEWNGDDVIRDGAGGSPVSRGDLAEYCSDWFEPKT